MINPSSINIEKESLASNRETPSTIDVGTMKDEDRGRSYRSWNDLIEIDKIDVEVVCEM